LDRKTWTIKQVLEWTTNHFAQKGLATPRLDAEVLLAYSLGVDRLYLYLNFERPLSKSERDIYRRSVRRRAKREPTALITGKKEFWSYGFRVVAGVLIPRPDTETLVECVLKEMSRFEDPVVLEIGIGSGAVAVSLLREHKRAVVVGTDVSMTALKLAMENAEEAGVRERFHAVAMDLFAAVRFGSRFDIICSNPPYIPSRDIETLEPEIKFFEPLSALDGGMDGLDFIRKIGHEAGRFLKPHGVLALEIGDGQSVMVCETLSNSFGIASVSVVKDLAGKDRVIMGCR
jgi:release factor glutamine methyltransferase